MLTTIAPWALLIVAFAAAVWAAIEARRTRRAVEALLQPSPLPSPQRNGGGGSGEE